MAVCFLLSSVSTSLGRPRRCQSCWKQHENKNLLGPVLPPSTSALIFEIFESEMVGVGGGWRYKQLGLCHALPLVDFANCHGNEFKFKLVGHPPLESHRALNVARSDLRPCLPPHMPDVLRISELGPQEVKRVLQLMAVAKF